MKKAVIITLIVLAFLSAGFIAFYFTVLRKKTPVVTAPGEDAIFTVDKLGNVYDSQGIFIGIDNGDDSFTGTTGAVYDFNGNVISPAPATQTTPVTKKGTPVVQQVVPPLDSIFNIHNWGLGY